MKLVSCLLMASLLLRTTVTAKQTLALLLLHILIKWRDTRQIN